MKALWQARWHLGIIALLVALLVVAMLQAAACGGSSPASAGATSPAVTSSTSPGMEQLSAETQGEATLMGETAGRPSAAVLDVLDGRIAAMNRGDGIAAAEFYATDARLEETDLNPDLVTRGRAEIGERLQGLADVGLLIERVGAPVQYERYVTEPVRFDQDGGPGYGAGMLVYEIGPDGLIAYQWVIGWVDSP